LAIAWYVRENFSEFRRLWAAPVSPPILAAISAAWLLMTVINSEITRRCLLALDLRLPVVEGLALNMAATAFNQVVPLKGGSGLRALYLARRRGVRLSGFVAVTASVSVMTLTTSSVFALLGLLWLSFRGQSVAGLLFLWFGAAAALGGLSLLYLGRPPFRLPKVLASAAAGWDRVRSTPNLMATLWRLQAAYFLAWALVNWLTLSYFQAEVGPPALLFFAGGQIHATLLNLTPAGLGLVEAISVLTGEAMDLAPATVLSAQALSRLTAIAWLSVLGTWGWLRLFRGAGPKGPKVEDDEKRR
jgi:uncharacterized membrane protein YbhN (UPF0104 family)